MKRFLLVILAIAMCGTVCACGGNKGNELVGVWESESGDVLTFYEDRTGTWSENQERNDHGELTWKIKGNILTMTISYVYAGTIRKQGPVEFKYTIDGSYLTLIRNDPKDKDTLIFTRKR